MNKQIFNACRQITQLMMDGWIDGMIVWIGRMDGLDD